MEREEARRLHSAIDPIAHEFSGLGYCGPCEQIQRTVRARIADLERQLAEAKETIGYLHEKNREWFNGLCASIRENPRISDSEMMQLARRACKDLEVERDAAEERLRRVREETLEQAARAVCPMCAEGNDPSAHLCRAERIRSLRAATEEPKP